MLWERVEWLSLTIPENGTGNVLYHKQTWKCVLYLLIITSEVEAFSILHIMDRSSQVAFEVTLPLSSPINFIADFILPQP